MTAYANLFVFFDDVLVYNASLTDHIQHLRVVLSLLQDNRAVRKQNKCQFSQPKLEYLGHIISAQVVEAEANKTAAMQCRPSLKP